MRKTAVVVMLALASGTAFADEEREERSPVWLGAFIGSSAVFAGSLTFYLYGAHRIDEESKLAEASNINGNGNLTEQDCDNPGIVDPDGHFRNACTWHDRTAIAGPMILVGGVAAVITGYLAFREMPKKDKRSVTLIPTVTTQTAGAMLDIRW